MTDRDFAQQPYSPDEHRVVEWLTARTPIGAGDDPIGFLLASYTLIRQQRDVAYNALRIARDVCGQGDCTCTGAMTVQQAAQQALSQP